MHNFIFIQKVQSIKNLESHPSDKVQRQPIVAVAFEKIIQISGKQIKYHADPTSKLKEFMNCNTAIHAKNILHFD